MPLALAMSGLYFANLNILTVECIVVCLSNAPVAVDNDGSGFVSLRCLKISLRFVTVFVI